MDILDANRSGYQLLLTHFSHVSDRGITTGVMDKLVELHLHFALWFFSHLYSDSVFHNFIKVFANT